MDNAKIQFVGQLQGLTLSVLAMILAASFSAARRRSSLLSLHLLPPPELVDLGPCDAVHRDCRHDRCSSGLWEAGSLLAAEETTRKRGGTAGLALNLPCYRPGVFVSG